MEIEIKSTDNWAWMKKYMMWEANRKTFQYPENWLEGELRDDKSQLFQDLESELLKENSSSEKYADALAWYLIGSGNNKPCEFSTLVNNISTLKDVTFDKKQIRKYLRVGVLKVINLTVLEEAEQKTTDALSKLEALRPAQTKGSRLISPRRMKKAIFKAIDELEKAKIEVRNANIAICDIDDKQVAKEMHDNGKAGAGTVL
jgi:hypothetical protein